MERKRLQWIDFRDNIFNDDKCVLRIRSYFIGRGRGVGAHAKQASRHETRSHFKWILYSFREWKRNSAFCTSYFFNRSFNPFFFFLVVPWYLKSISLFLAVPLLRKKIEKENQIIGTNTLFKYTYTSNFCATFRSVILSIPFRVLSFPNLSRYRCTLCNETFWPAEVSVGSRSNSRAKFTEKSRAARPYVILFSFTHGSGNRSISIRGREPAPDADFNQTIARRIDHSISFDVR